MENALSQILFACNLARQLEANLSTIAHRPESLLSSCEEVAVAFDLAIRRLKPQDSPPVGTRALLEEASGSGMRFGFEESAKDVREERKAMDLLGLRTEEDDYPFYVRGSPTLGIGSGFSTVPSAPPVGGGEQQAPSDHRRRPSGSSSHRSSRKRKESSGMHTIRVSALRAGNMDIPPDDGFTWRKYGQKDILGSKFPRSYYRCTHKNFYGCEAKKQVQRLDEDPYTYEVTYCGDHTCLTSPNPLDVLQSNIIDVHLAESIPTMPVSTRPQSTTSSISTSIQLGIDWSSSSSKQFDFYSRSGGGETSGGNVGPPECLVADLADAMFNSASSGSSMDAIFSLKHGNYKDKEE